MPTTHAGKAIASRNSTTHGVFARDVVLPSLGEDPEGYRRLQDQWTAQLVPRNLLEQHYVEKIAAASWRLRRLHRWQAQLFEAPKLTENDRLDRLDKVLRHETALHRQIDTAVRMLHKEAPQLYRQRLREQIQEDLHISERECRDEIETDTMVELKIFDRLWELRKETALAATELTTAPLDTENREICEHEPGAVCHSDPAPEESVPDTAAVSAEHEAETGSSADNAEKCENEPAPWYHNPRRLSEYLDPDQKTRIPVFRGTREQERLLRRGG